ncbi:MAG TPA: DoxX family protein [Candidatus Binatia bacterium]|nr:DoxX family protein [Candidatus Binatia bacterium]
MALSAERPVAVGAGEAVRPSDVHVERPAIGLAGRILFTLIFFLSGITHFTGMADYVALMPSAIPFRPFWVAISGVVELAGATMILTNRYPRLGGWLIALFLVPVTIVVHGVWMVTDPDPRMRAIQISFFLKGLAMTGCALLITQLGVSQPNGARGRSR